MEIRQAINFLYFRTLTSLSFRGLLMLIPFALLLLAPSIVIAQDDDFFGSAEDDTLLFGEEFDLGDDDFGFDFGDEEESDEGAIDDAGDDEFSFDFEDDEDGEEEVADEDAADLGDEWGFEDESEDYENLITRTVEGEDVPIGGEQTDHPLDFRDNVQGTFLESTGITLSFRSPHVVTENLETWYSFIDYSLTADLPWHLTFYPVELTFSVDISSFNFENSFPVGGAFRGLTVIPMAKAEAFGAELELGAGLFYPTFGVLAGAGYTIQYYSIFASAGYRWNWVYDIDPIGSNWWLEPRFTLGVRFW